ncbi:peptide methionine sulfoxide reductase [Mycena filopes]|nr:peptide methionine sulfoxide reductase [Mycena filopes]
MSTDIQIATFASGCFWGTEYMFLKQFSPEEGKGIVRSSVGFADTTAGGGDFAEAVRIEFEPKLVSYAELVEFFYRSHDPTTRDAQGADKGSEYRSAIFTHSEQQAQIAKRVTAEIQEKYFSPKGKTIVTQIDALGKWQAAQEGHQKYLFRNPNGYHCRTHVLHW